MKGDFPKLLVKKTTTTKKKNESKVKRKTSLRPNITYY